MQSNSSTPSRREMVAAGTGLLAAPILGSAALAQPGASSTATGGNVGPVNAAAASAALKMQNPLEEYPKPPFKQQHQEAPGLASKMDPRPDHGEESYIGSGKLIGRKALITGGDSGIGRAAAIAYAREGADVATTSPWKSPTRKRSSS